MKAKNEIKEKERKLGKERKRKQGEMRGKNDG